MSVVWPSIAAEVKIGLRGRCLPVECYLVNVSDMNVQGTKVGWTFMSVVWPRIATEVKIGLK